MQTTQQWAKWLSQGSTPVSNLLLQNYKQIALTDQEMMLLIHLHSFATEGNDFPSLDELQQRMCLTEEEIPSLLSRLLKDGFVDIYSSVDSEQKRKESFSLQPLWERLCEYLVYQEQQKQMQNEAAVSLDSSWPEAKDKLENEHEGQLFKRFEQEFARPLSPMEIESSIWLDQDQYDPALILLALREAVISNKLSLRYIDRILFEWQKNGIKTTEAAREYSKRFRQKQAPLQKKEQEKVEFTFYNWLDEKR